MQLRNLLLFGVTVLALISSCQSKVPYGSSYYFKLKEYEKAERQLVPTQLQKRPIESIAANELLTFKGKKVVIHDRPGNTSVDLGNQQPVVTENKPVVPGKLSRKEKIAARKEIKKTLRENKERVKEFMLSDEKQQEDLFRAGLIIGLGGLALLVLGLAFGISLLTGVGSLAIVVGFVLILIDLI
jgi:hypothetical protein